MHATADENWLIGKYWICAELTRVVDAVWQSCDCHQCIAAGSLVHVTVSVAFVRIWYAVPVLACRLANTCTAAGHVVAPTRLLRASPAGPGYVATPIWDRQEITSTVAQYKETEYAASLEAFDKRIIEDVQKGHAPGDIARWSPVGTRVLPPVLSNFMINLPCFYVTSQMKQLPADCTHDATSGLRRCGSYK